MDPVMIQELSKRLLKKNFLTNFKVEVLSPPLPPPSSLDVINLIIQQSLTNSP